MQFETGDYVRIKPEFRNPCEGDELYVVTSINGNTRRCYIALAHSNLPLNPQELVSVDVIEKVITCGVIPGYHAGTPNACHTSDGHFIFSTNATLRMAGLMQKIYFDRRYCYD